MMPFKNHSKLIIYGNPYSRIFGGKEIFINEIPYLVSIQDQYGGKNFYRHACGGTFITKNWVLTAAHCVTDDNCILRPPNVFLVVSGTTFWDKETPSSKESKVKTIYVHKRYNCENFYYDIATVELRKHIGIKLVTLPKYGMFKEKEPDLYFTKNCLVAGWGRIDNPNASQTRLRKGYLTLKPLQLCNDSYAYIFRKQLCTFREGVDVCYGDSGGPLICRGFQVGITSYGSGCGENPGVWTRVDSYLGWIKRHSSLQSDSDRHRTISSQYFYILFILAFIYTTLFI